MKEIVRILFLLLILFQCMFLYSTNTCAQEQDPQLYPQRIISLAPSLTEGLFLLGVEEKLVGVTTYCQRPPAAQKKEKIGSLTSVDLEKIFSLESDLVLAASLTNPKTIEKLKNLKIEVINFSPAKNFSQVCEQFLELGKIVGKEKRAKEVVSKAKNKVGLIKKKVKRLPRQRVFVQIGSKPLFAATKDYVVNDFIELAGGINVAYDLKSGLYSREKVLKDNPDVIIIVTMGIAGVKEKKTWKNYRALKAAKNNKIYIVDSYKVCAPTPASFVEGLEEIAKILHPEDIGE